MTQIPFGRGKDLAQSPSQHMRASLQDKAIGGPLVAWGIGNVMIAVLQVFLSPLGPQIGVNFGELNKYFMVTFGGWIAVALSRRSTLSKLPLSMVFLILVQVWFTVSTIVAQAQLGRHIEFIAPDYSLVTFILAFVQGAMLVSIAPHLRKVMTKGLIAICLVSAVVAVLQFLDFGPASALGNALVGFEDITNWAGQGGVRAVGIFPSVILPVHYNLIAIGLISAALFYRKLKPAEISLIIVLIGVMMMSQVRNATVLIALVLLPLIALFVRRHRIGALPYVVAGVVVLIAMVIYGGDRFQYMFSGDTSTLDYRRNVLWPQAINILENRPWFGIGVEPALAGFPTAVTDRWSSGTILDNGYLVAAAFGGIPALTFMILAVLSAIIGSVALVMRKTEDRWEKGYAIAAVVIALAFGYGMMFGNMITNISLGMFYFVAAGMAMPSKSAQGALLLGKKAAMRRL